MKKYLSKFLRLSQAGDSTRDIILYWLPELVSATILISLPPMIDSWIVSRLGSLTVYGALGMGRNFLHTLIKWAESIPVAAIAIIGRHNGAKEYEKCGESLGDTFWTTFILGFSQFLIILLSASAIYTWLGVPEQMVAVGTPFLQKKSFGVFLIFTSLGLLGFMRAVKNTRIPMLINITGIIVFIFFDYALVLGNFGFPRMELNGSALATIIQYSVMNVLALIYILTNPEYKKYFSKVFFAVFDIRRALRLLNLSWQIIADKSAIGFSYIWLSKMLAPLGAYAIATYDTVNNLERFAFLPVMASAQVLTFLVSNRLGAKDPEGALINIKKILFLTCITVIPSLLILSFNAHYFVGIFDPNNNFSDFAATVLPIISVLVILDFTQVVLAAALRGAGDTRTVMVGRVLACGLFFFPVSWMLSKLPIQNTSLKFILIYGSFCITTGIMGIIFLYRIKSHKWYKKTI